MIFSNLSGTTSSTFKVSADGKGQIQCNNTYDLFWAGNNPKGGRNPNVTQLTFGTDLNNIRTPGQYFAEGMTNEYPNCPTSTGFIMTVEPTGGITYPNYVTQRLYDFGGNLYVRTSNGLSSSWASWKQMAYKSDVPVESGTFSFTPTYDRLVLSNPRAWYNRVGNMVFVYATSSFTLLDNNTPYIIGSFQGLPYKYDNEYFGFGNCAIKYYPIDSTKVSCGFSCWTASSTGLGFRISINCIGTDSNGQYISTDYPFGMAMKANIQSFFQAGFWYKMA